MQSLSCCIVSELPIATMMEMSAKDVRQDLFWPPSFALRCSILQKEELRASTERVADAMADYEKLKPFLF